MQKIFQSETKLLKFSGALPFPQTRPKDRVQLKVYILFEIMEGFSLNMLSNGKIEPFLGGTKEEVC